MRFLAPAAALVLVVAAFVAVSPAVAQTATATLDVVAVDGAGAPLPGVIVELKRPETGLARSGVTGSAGLATFAALPPGTYDVAVKLAGFETVEQKGL
ncbi:MAG TPA: carboxypeptidase-like regulatory domain-containing protein, partial [Thermoanaerobaculia bacterium]|nr:carboxypeptidase-like regulatory domain-containing protein [Thermoanaerobaculia bacterium]